MLSCLMMPSFLPACVSKPGQKNLSLNGKQWPCQAGFCTRDWDNILINQYYQMAAQNPGSHLNHCSVSNFYRV